MPKLAEHNGFIFFIYSNDHPLNPIHVHVKKAEKEIRLLYKEESGVFWFDHEIIRGKFNPSEISKIKEFAKKNWTSLYSKLQSFVINKDQKIKSDNKKKKGRKKGSSKTSQKDS